MSDMMSEEHGELIHRFRISPSLWDAAIIDAGSYMLYRARREIDKQLPEGAEITDYVIEVCAEVKLREREDGLDIDDFVNDEE